VRALLVAVAAFLGCASTFERTETVIVDFPLPGDAWAGQDVIGTRAIPGVVVDAELTDSPCDRVRVSSAGTDYVIDADVTATIKGTNCDASAPPGRLTLHMRAGR
jgi:hypothetical protein